MHIQNIESWTVYTGETCLGSRRLYCADVTEVKSFLLHATEVCGGVEGQLHSFSIPTLDAASGQPNDRTALCPLKFADTHCTEGSVDHIAGLGTFERFVKSLLKCITKQ